jgi:hypothetical protein
MHTTLPQVGLTRADYVLDDPDYAKQLDKQSDAIRYKVND